MKTYKFKINGNEFNVDINGIDGNVADVSVNGASYKVEMENAPAAATAVKNPRPVQSTTANTAVPPAQTAPEAQPAKNQGEGKAVTSPLPGVIIEVSVKEGQVVKAGEKVAVIEAMKMENEIKAPNDAVVASVAVTKGQSVNTGDLLVSLK